MRVAGPWTRKRGFKVNPLRRRLISRWPIRRHDDLLPAAYNRLALLLQFVRQMANTRRRWFNLLVCGAHDARASEAGGEAIVTSIF
jgi:hypothetical protein